MQNKSYIPAFTTVDILTGMVVMTIVVVMVFYLISATFQQTVGYESSRFELNRYLVFKADLKRQVELADEVQNHPQGFKLVSQSAEILYVQEDHLLLRKLVHHTDTLTHHLTLLTKKSVTNRLTGIESEILEQIHLEVDFSGVKLSCELHKDYGLSEYINESLIYEF